MNSESPIKDLSVFKMIKGGHWFWSYFCCVAIQEKHAPNDQPYGSSVVSPFDLDKGALYCSFLLSGDWFRHILACSSGLANQQQGVYFSPIFGIFLMELAQRFLTAIYLLHSILSWSVWSYHLPNILTLLIYPSFSFELQLNWKACLLTYSIDTGIHSKYLFSSPKTL